MLRLTSSVFLIVSVATAVAAEPSFTVMLSPGVAPCTVHVNGLTALPAGVDPTACGFDWDFGDPGAPYDTLRGFNAAHCYGHAGSYTIRLTLTDPAGARREMSAKLVVTKDTRRLIFVAPDGSDGNTGLSPDAPLRSLPKALDKLGDDGEVLLRAGGTYRLETTLQLRRRDALVSRYGDGPDPLLSKLNRGSILSTAASCDGVVLRHLQFTTPNDVQPGGQAPKVGTDAIIARGRNLSVVDCTFNNVDEAINGNGSPTGLLVQNCKAPSVTSLRAYLVWGQGTDQVYVGNVVANSTREHCIRTSGVSRLLVAYNTLANLDRRPADKYDTSKGCIEVHQGDYAWVANNTVTDGDIRTGPYGGKGEPPTSATEWCVVENNVVNETCVSVQCGSHHVRVRNNVVHADNMQAFVINGPDAFGRTCRDIAVVGNTAVNHAAGGAFIKIWGKVDGLSLMNNLYVAPNLRPGVSGAAAVNTQRDDLLDFTDISGNVWPTPPKGGVICHLGTRGYIKPDQWLAQPQVKRDRFDNVNWADPTSQPTTAP